MFASKALIKKWGSFSVILACLLLLNSAYAVSEQLAPASAGVCQTSNGPTGYQVTVCLTEPANGATLTGARTVTATVTVSGTAPGVQRAIFYLDNQYLLIDYAAAYTFVLPTNRFVDGTHSLQVEALMRDGFTSTRTSLNLIFNNGVTTPPTNTRTFTPSKGSAPSAGNPLVVAVVGDGAGGENNETQVVNLIDSWDPNLLLYLGDVYEKGSMAEFYNWYGLTSSTTFYGRFRAITNPAIGNHEYENGVAPGYFDYWDNVPNYYSFNSAGWHFISLNSTSQFNQTATNSPQYLWLAQDLNTNPAPCTIVFFHHPVYNIGPQGDTTRMNNIWALMAQRGVDIALTAHDHNYQRWDPLNGQGVRDPQGVTQFVVGTGGHGLQRFVRSDPRVDESIDDIYGALRLKLYADRAEFKFRDTAGTTLDSGTVPCVNAAPLPTPTRTPTGPAPTASHTPTRTSTPSSGGTATPTRTPTNTPPPQNLVFIPVADAYVSAGHPDSDYGDLTELHVDASPVRRAYLRFEVQGVNSSVTRATLRIFSQTSSSLGYNVHPVSNNTWNELTVTYNTAPAFGGIIGSSGSLGTGAWSTVDVTSLVSGNGLISVVLTTSDTNTLILASREAGANAPQLVVQTN
jgi:hypothetical protein